MTPQETQAAQEGVKKIPGGSEVLKDVAEAGAIMGAASVIPGIGTAAGAVVAAVAILGPKLFKGISGLFSETNKWPDRIKKLEHEPDPERRYLAAWALAQLAYKHSVMKDPPGKRRWVEAALRKISDIRDQAFAAIPWQQRRAHGLDVGVNLRATSLPELQYQILPALQRNLNDPKFQPGMVQALIAETMAEIQTRQPLTRDQLFSEIRRVEYGIQSGRLPDRVGAARYLDAARAEYNRRFAAAPELPPPPPDALAPPTLPPAPPPAPPLAPPPVASPWPIWFRAAFAAQRARAAVPPPPPIPAVLPPGLAPEWQAWASWTRNAQSYNLPPPNPPPIPLPWAA